jgi:FkbM family methyltransferase
VIWSRSAAIVRSADRITRSAADQTMEWRPVSVTLLGPVVVSSSRLLPGVRFSPAERRVRLLKAYGIDLVIDVGANAGQYAAALRAAGYRGRIVSFEPVSEPYGRLATASGADKAWECQRLALDRGRGTARVNVSEDTRNSSVLSVGDRHLRAVPDSRPVGVESASMARLDAIWSDAARGARRPYLKMDVQGYELEVLHGSTGVLDVISLVEVELSLFAVYDAGPLFQDVFRFLRRHDFVPIAFEGVLDDAGTGEMLQADGIFRRGT